jgi:hypothetical protein
VRKSNWPQGYFLMNRLESYPATNYQEKGHRLCPFGLFWSSYSTAELFGAVRLPVEGTKVALSTAAM